MSSSCSAATKPRSTKSRKSRIKIVVDGAPFCAQARLRRLDDAIARLSVYALAAVVFGSLQVVLLVLNAQANDVFALYNAPFHLVEFWAVAVFLILEAYVLSTTSTAAPPAASSQSRWIRALWLTTTFATIMTALAAAVLISFDLLRFDVAAHLLEYVAQVPITLMDVVFVVARRADGDSGTQRSRSDYAFGAVALALTLASVVQLLVFVGVFDFGRLSNDRAAHFFEFTIDLCNAAFALQFAVRVRHSLQAKCDSLEQTTRPI